MMYKAKVAVCSDIRTKHSTQSERHVEFLNVKPGGTERNARLWKVEARVLKKKSISFKIVYTIYKKCYRNTKEELDHFGSRKLSRDKGSKL